MKGVLPMAVFTLAFLLIVSPASATISCSQTDSSKTIPVGETGDITVQCSGITQGTTVTVNAQYSSSCLSAQDNIPFSLTYDNPSAQITFEATSMSCQYNSDDRTISWSFTSPGESISSQNTLVTITSALSVTGSFKNAPYSATVGSETTVVLEISTGASVDITDVDVDMTTSPTISDITDWNDNTIYSSGSQKTVQKSWTFTAPSANTYSISATITTQNAAGDQESTTLTTTSGSGGITPGGPGGGGPGGGGAAPSHEKNASRKHVLVPGVGLRSNLKLQAAIQKVLGLASMSEQARQNLLRLSESISSQIEVTRNFRSANSTSTMETRFSNKGSKAINNFMVFDTVPKEFAEHSGNITVTAPGAQIEVVNPDPEYLFTYPAFDPNQEAVITYSVGADVPETVIEDFHAEVYAESVEEAPPCSEGETMCLGNDLRVCQNKTWVTRETCQYGCENGACKAQPPVLPITIDISFLMNYWLYILIIIVVVVVIAAALLLRKGKPSHKYKEPRPFSIAEKSPGELGKF